MSDVQVTFVQQIKSEAHNVPDTIEKKADGKHRPPLIKSKLTSYAEEYICDLIGRKNFVETIYSDSPLESYALGTYVMRWDATTPGLINVYLIEAGVEVGWLVNGVRPNPVLKCSFRAIVDDPSVLARRVPTSARPTGAFNDVVRELSAFKLNNLKHREPTPAPEVTKEEPVKPPYLGLRTMNPALALALHNRDEPTEETNETVDDFTDEPTEEDISAWVGLKRPAVPEITVTETNAGAADTVAADTVAADVGAAAAAVSGSPVFPTVADNVDSALCPEDSQQDHAIPEAPAAPVIDMDELRDYATMLQVVYFDDAMDAVVNQREPVAELVQTAAEHVAEIVQTAAEQVAEQVNTVIDEQTHNDDVTSSFRKAVENIRLDD